jgi:hypothetical protein
MSDDRSALGSCLEEYDYPYLRHGGLIAWQLKQWTLVRNVALDFAATVFMGALFTLFLHPLSLRYVATFFLVFYVVGGIIVIRQNLAHASQALFGFHSSSLC